MAIVKDMDGFIDPLLSSFQSSLRYKLNGHVAMAYISGSAEMTSWGHTKGGIPITYEGPPIQQAVDYAEKHCAKLVTKIDEETKQRLAKIVSDGIKNKRGVPGLARDIKSEFGDMSRYRSKLIARTETADALEQSFMDRAKEMGIEGKEWVWPGGDCGICADCAALGVVPLDFDFPHNGDDPKRPPAHPNCRCALAPARLNK